jgi:rubredoxin
MFTSTVSAARAHEATLVVVDAMMHRCSNIEFEYVDSKGWQKDQLPAGTKGSEQLKLRSMQYGCREFPEHAELITKHKDADGLLIANFCRGQYS